jgi:hypothetical protein
MMGVDLPREVDCMRCGAPTSGLATCELCFEAITELRALAIDHDAPNTAPFRHLPRSLARTEVDRIGSVDAGE